MYNKDYCSKCNLDGDCVCQKTSQTMVNNCGMEFTIKQNECYRREIQNGTLTFDSLRDCR